jgi:hypothetical protein
MVAGGSGGNLQLEAGGVESAEFYKYVGAMITENVGSTDEIKNRINQGRILTKQIVFRGVIKLPKNTKIRIYKRRWWKALAYMERKRGR